MTMRILNLSAHFNVLHLFGDQAEIFLQSQLTNDVRETNSDQLQWQAYCTRDGLVQSIFGLWGKEKDYYLLLSHDLVDTTLQLLQKYARFSKVSMTLLSFVTIELAIDVAPEKNMNWQVKSFDSKLLQLNWQSIFPAGADDFMLMRAALIDHAFPWLCKETSGSFRPHDIHLPQLKIVCFKKGCFPGQEIIARMQYRGKPKQGLYVFHLPGKHLFLPGQNIVKADKSIGHIVDVCYFSEHTALSVVLQHEWSDKVWYA